jgi:SAM-dependent methyltransferase
MREPGERSWDQAAIDWLEQRALQRILVANGLIGKQLLDVPCGYGRFWRTLDRLQVRPVGIDLDREMLRKAAAYDSLDRDRRTACGDIFRLPFRDDSFECVVCIRLLHLSFSQAERLAILREIARVSSRLVIVSIYRHTGLHALARRFNSTPGRVKLMTGPEFHPLVQASGLRLESARPLLPHVHMQTFVTLTKATGAQASPPSGSGSI